jgi:hypothetical protein
VRVSEEERERTYSSRVMPLIPINKIPCTTTVAILRQFVHEQILIDNLIHGLMLVVLTGLLLLLPPVSKGIIHTATRDELELGAAA